MKNSKNPANSGRNAARIVCLVLAGLFVLSIIIVPIIYACGS